MVGRTWLGQCQCRCLEKDGQPPVLKRCKAVRTWFSSTPRHASHPAIPERISQNDSCSQGGGCGIWVHVMLPRSSPRHPRCCTYQCMECSSRFTFYVPALCRIGTLPNDTQRRRHPTRAQDPTSAAPYTPRCTEAQPSAPTPPAPAPTAGGVTEVVAGRAPP